MKQFYFTSSRKDKDAYLSIFRLVLAKRITQNRTIPGLLSATFNKGIIEKKINFDSRVNDCFKAAFVISPNEINLYKTALIRTYSLYVISRLVFNAKHKLNSDSFDIQHNRAITGYIAHKKIQKLFKKKISLNYSSWQKLVHPARTLAGSEVHHYATALNAQVSQKSVSYRHRNRFFKDKALANWQVGSLNLFNKFKKMNQIRVNIYGYKRLARLSRRMFIFKNLINSNYSYSATKVNQKRLNFWRARSKPYQRAFKALRGPSAKDQLRKFYLPKYLSQIKLRNLEIFNNNITRIRGLNDSYKTTLLAYASHVAVKNKTFGFGIKKATSMHMLLGKENRLYKSTMENSGVLKSSHFNGIVFAKTLSSCSVNGLMLTRLLQKKQSIVNTLVKSALVSKNSSYFTLSKKFRTSFSSLSYSQRPYTYKKNNSDTLTPDRLLVLPEQNFNQNLSILRWLGYKYKFGSLFTPKLNSPKYFLFINKIIGRRRRNKLKRKKLKKKITIYSYFKVARLRLKKKGKKLLNTGYSQNIALSAKKHLLSRLLPNTKLTNSLSTIALAKVVALLADFGLGGGISSHLTSTAFDLITSIPAKKRFVSYLIWGSSSSIATRVLNQGRSLYGKKRAELRMMRKFYLIGRKGEKAYYKVRNLRSLGSRSIRTSVKRAIFRKRLGRGSIFLKGVNRIIRKRARRKLKSQKRKKRNWRYFKVKKIFTIFKKNMKHVTSVPFSRKLRSIKQKKLIGKKKVVRPVSSNKKVIKKKLSKIQLFINRRKLLKKNKKKLSLKRSSFKLSTRRYLRNRVDVFGFNTVSSISFTSFTGNIVNSLLSVYGKDKHFKHPRVLSSKISTDRASPDTDILLASYSFVASNIKTVFDGYLFKSTTCSSRVSSGFSAFMVKKKMRIYFRNKSFLYKNIRVVGAVQNKRRRNSFRVPTIPSIKKIIKRVSFFRRKGPSKKNILVLDKSTYNLLKSLRSQQNMDRRHDALFNIRRSYLGNNGNPLGFIKTSKVCTNFIYRKIISRVHSRIKSNTLNKKSRRVLLSKVVKRNTPPIWLNNKKKMYVLRQLPKFYKKLINRKMGSYKFNPSHFFIFKSKIRRILRTDNPSRKLVKKRKPNKSRNIKSLKKLNVKKKKILSTKTKLRITKKKFRHNGRLVINRIRPVAWLKTLSEIIKNPKRMNKKKKKLKIAVKRPQITKKVTHFRKNFPAKRVNFRWWKYNGRARYLRNKPKYLRGPKKMSKKSIARIYRNSLRFRYVKRFSIRTSRKNINFKGFSSVIRRIGSLFVADRKNKKVRRIRLTIGNKILRRKYLKGREFSTSLERFGPSHRALTNKISLRLLSKATTRSRKVFTRLNTGKAAFPFGGVIPCVMSMLDSELTAQNIIYAKSAPRYKQQPRYHSRAQQLEILGKIASVRRQWRAKKLAHKLLKKSKHSNIAYKRQLSNVRFFSKRITLKNYSSAFILRLGKYLNLNLKLDRKRRSRPTKLRFAKKGWLRRLRMRRTLYFKKFEAGYRNKFRFRPKNRLTKRLRKLRRSKKAIKRVGRKAKRLYRWAKLRRQLTIKNKSSLSKLLFGAKDRYGMRAKYRHIGTISKWFYKKWGILKTFRNIKARKVMRRKLKANSLRWGFSRFLQLRRINTKIKFAKRALKLTKLKFSGAVYHFGVRKSRILSQKFKFPVRYVYAGGIYKQFYRRKMPFGWYKVKRKKFPLKNRKKYWSLRIPTWYHYERGFSRVHTFYDGSVSLNRSFLNKKQTISQFKGLRDYSNRLAEDLDILGTTEGVRIHKYLPETFFYYTKRFLPWRIRKRIFYGSKRSMLKGFDIRYSRALKKISVKTWRFTSLAKQMYYLLTKKMYNFSKTISKWAIRLQDEHMLGYYSRYTLFNNRLTSTAYFIGNLNKIYLDRSLLKDNLIASFCNLSPLAKVIHSPAQRAGMAYAHRFWTISKNISLHSMYSNINFTGSSQAYGTFSISRVLFYRGLIKSRRLSTRKFYARRKYTPIGKNSDHTDTGFIHLRLKKIYTDVNLDRFRSALLANTGVNYVDNGFRSQLNSIW